MRCEAGAMPALVLNSIGIHYGDHVGQHPNSVQCKTTVEWYFRVTEGYEPKFLAPFRFIKENVSNTYRNRFDRRFLKPVMDFVLFHWSTPYDPVRVKKIMKGINVNDFIQNGEDANTLIDIYNFKLTESRRLNHIVTNDRTKPAPTVKTDTTPERDYSKIGRLIVELLDELR